LFSILSLSLAILTSHPAGSLPRDRVEHTEGFLRVDAEDGNDHRERWERGEGVHRNAHETGAAGGDDLAHDQFCAVDHGDLERIMGWSGSRGESRSRSRSRVLHRSNDGLSIDC
jgi:hypothetical protein